MIESITAINALGERLLLDFSDPWSSGMLVTLVDGLGPVEGQVNQSKASTGVGVRTNSTTAGGRNVVLKLKLLDKPTAEDVRLETYRFFPVLEEVTLLIKSGRRYATVTGTVETNKPDIFASEPTTTISILSDDTYLFDATPQGIVSTLFYSVEDAFEFPFSNESLTSKLIEFGRIKSEYTKEVAYLGDVPTGVVITITALGDAGDLVIYNPVSNAAIRISSTKIQAKTGFGIIAGDVITIDTRDRKKGVWLLRKGTTTRILNSMERGSDWLQMIRGTNKFAYSAAYGAANLQISIQSQVLYQGV